MADESTVPPAVAEKMRKERQDRLEAEKAAKAYDKAIVYPETVKPDDRKAKGGSVKSNLPPFVVAASNLVVRPRAGSCNAVYLCKAASFHASNSP
jgi:hypothetical protein